MSRILLSYIGYPVGAGKFLKKALRNMGHEVVHIGPDAKGYLPWQPQADFSKYADKPDLPLPYPTSGTFHMEDAIAMAGEVDLVIQCDANFYLTGVAPVPNVVWAIDNHVVKYDVIEPDIYFGAHSWAYGHEKKNFVWLPCAYSPSDHYQIPNHARSLDLLFLGVVYQHRGELLNLLAPFGKVGAGMGVLGDEYNEGYNSSRMALCLSACGDLPMRVFENAAQGCMIFCDKQKDLERLGLKEGEHYVGFSNQGEAVEKFKSLMAEPERVVAIAKAGKAALRDETYEYRVGTMFSHL